MIAVHTLFDSQPDGPVRVSARKKIMGGGQLENTNLLKKGDLSSEHFLEGLH